MYPFWIMPLLLSAPLTAAGLPDVGFAGLTAHTFESQCFGPRSVHFDPVLAQPLNDFEEIPDHPAGGYRTVLSGRLVAKGMRYTLRYDDGPSCDPTYSLWPEGGDEPIGEFGGDHVVVPGNGYLYVIRRSNRSFEGREKWAIEHGALVEVTQSHYYVGVSTPTLKPLSLLQQPAADSTVIANVPKGEKVLVVVQQTVDGRDWYLVRTRFGLLGWTEDAAYGDERQFEDIQFLGD
ncbi:MAG TPA: SH3 domain-containing protein [Xanthomonadales bacterium]|nr:SH3 domain-containing protein [Xanthomonadales bacterium]